MKSFQSRRPLKSEYQHNPTPVLLTRSAMPQNSINTPLYKSHPLWPWRRLSLIAIVSGVLLAIISIIGGSRAPAFAVYSIVLQLSSLAFIVWDLWTWTHAGTVLLREHLARVYECIRNHRSTDDSEHPPLEVLLSSNSGATDETPPWRPTKLTITLDFALSVLFLYIFFLILGFSSSYPWYMATSVSLVYGNLANLVLALMHAKAAWRELMARKRMQWEEERDGTTENAPEGSEAACHGTEAQGPTSRVRSRWLPTFPNIFSTSAAVDLEAGVPVPSDEGEEDLLITPSEEESTSAQRAYGTAGEQRGAAPKPIKEHKIKRKGSKRVIGEEWATVRNGNGKERATENEEDGDSGA
jgi:hypothetical protein